MAFVCGFRRCSEERAGAASAARRARQTPLLMSQRKQGSTCGVSVRKAIRPELLGQGQREGHPGLAVTRRMITALKAEGFVPEASPPPTIIAEAEAINPLASCVCTLGQGRFCSQPTRRVSRRRQNDSRTLFTHHEWLRPNFQTVFLRH